MHTINQNKSKDLIKVLHIVFDAHPQEKVLIFTQFVETQTFLAGVLESQGYSVVTFNGQLKLEEKEEAVARFRHRAQILISTEAGGEGRNFQFCHILVNYDLPWNPMKVEQRIGRIDRIGQRKPVFIYNLACAGTLEERVLNVLQDRIGLFEESVGSLDPILGEIERDIEQILMEQAERFDEVFKEFEERLERRVREARERERTLADFVLDRASLRRDVADELLGRTPLARYSDLEQFIQDALSYYGGSLDEHAEGGQVVSLSPKLAAQLRTRRNIVRGVFDWRQALELENLDFFAFGHELVDRIVELPVHIDPATTGVRRLPIEGAEPQVEIFYQVRGEGIRPSGKIIRHLTGPNLEVISEEVVSYPESGEVVEGIDVPAWVGEAIKASKRRFEQELTSERGQLRRESDGVKLKELAREERIFGYRQVRLERIIEEQVKWIEEKERTGTERERRVLPARRGKLLKDRERLERLRFEHEEQVAQIQKRETGLAAEILSAGLVIGP
jgi:ElaB/YqjD/DUF883 family membrane-anchored ribosome-binding protein/CheY-like chemotaxis protein